MALLRMRRMLLQLDEQLTVSKDTTPMGMACL